MLIKYNFKYNFNFIYIIVISSILFIFGILFYLIYNNHLVIKFNLTTPVYIKHIKKERKLVKLYFYNNSWIEEEKELIQSSNILESLRYIINSWLNISYEEKYILKKIFLDNILIDSKKEVIFLSFSKSFLNKNDSIKKKLYIIESLLKTIRSNNKDIKYIFFLVDNKPMQDYHFNFEKPFPISGYINSNSSKII